MRRFIYFGLILSGFFSLTGCTVIFKKSDTEDIRKIYRLGKEVDKLKGDLESTEEARARDLERLKRARALEKTLNELVRAKADLERRLRKEIGDKQVAIQMQERGLVITVVAEVLFDSGKARIRPEAYKVLDEVASVLNSHGISAQAIGIEGHTDNEPIKYSGWKSNWELSTARATSVLHYVVDEKGVAPERVSAIGYGEYRPVASNDDDKGRAKNRRVEIIVMPELSKKVRGTAGEVEEVPSTAAKEEEIGEFIK